jgi:2-hydroxychromene-2-carboxylate isomerase
VQCYGLAIGRAKLAEERIEFFYDLSSPWTYLAFTNLADVLERTATTARLRPVLVGGIFNAVNQSVYAAREATDNRKLKHSWQVLKDWASLAGVEMNFPSKWHPAKSVNAMRMACALADDQPALCQFTKAAFESYFGGQENLDDPDILVAVANSAGLNGEAMRAASQTDAVKALLRANTQEVIERGGYGSPTIFVDSKWMYFGNDQLPLVEFKLKENAA